MSRLLVSAVGFTPAKIIRPALMTEADAVLLVSGDDQLSKLTIEQVRAALPEIMLRVESVADWDIVALGRRTKAAVADAVRSLGGRSHCHVVVNLSAGHGFFHAVLAHQATAGGHAMCLWTETANELRMASPPDLLDAPLSALEMRLLRALAGKVTISFATVRGTVNAPTSSAYHALAALERAGLVVRPRRGHVGLTIAGSRLISSRPPEGR